MLKLPQVNRGLSFEHFAALDVLRTSLREPRTEVAVLRVFHRQAVPHVLTVDLGESVEHAQRARFAAEQLGEVRLAEPG